MSELQVEPLEKALDQLRTGLELAEKDPSNELLRDGVIQRFEFTFELSWKLLKRYLEIYGLERLDAYTNKDFFRAGHEQAMIRDAEPWLEYLKMRNLAAHVYNEEIAREVYQTARDLVQDAAFLLDKLKEKTQ